MTIVIHTGRLIYSGPDRLDVSRQGDDALGKHFGPSWDILTQARAARRAGALIEGLDPWDWYVPRYTGEMRGLYKARPELWWELLARREVTLVCFCSSPAHCHRRLLADFVRAVGGALGVEAQLAGERPPSRPDGNDVLERRRAGWVEHRHYQWIVRRGRQVLCFHCGDLDEREEGFADRHAGCRSPMVVG